MHKGGNHRHIAGACEQKESRQNAIRKLEERIDWNRFFLAGLSFSESTAATARAVLADRILGPRSSYLSCSWVCRFLTILISTTAFPSCPSPRASPSPESGVLLPFLSTVLISRVKLGPQTKYPMNGSPGSDCCLGFPELLRQLSHRTALPEVFADHGHLLTRENVLNSIELVRLVRFRVI